MSDTRPHHAHPLAVTRKAAEELGRIMARWPVTADTRGHARYLGTDSRGDVFLVGYSLPCRRVWWDYYATVGSDGVARIIPESEAVFGFKPVEYSPS